MIVPMLKYTFLVFHREYKSFLKKIQELGVVHVAKKDLEISDEIRAKYAEINACENTILFLKRREIEQNDVENQLNESEIIQDIFQKQKEEEDLETKLEETIKLHDRVQHWGDFSPELIDKLNTENIHLRFFSVNRKKYAELQKKGFYVEIISEQGSQLFVVLIQTGDDLTEIDAEELQLPKVPYTQLEKQISDLQNKIKTINSFFDEYAATSIAKLQRYKAELIDVLKFDTVILNTSKQAENKLMVLEGWVPKSKKTALNQFLENHGILYVATKATPRDDIPVMLQNNRFSRLFEPIGTMFSLPDYSEMDLTVFFAPFFMLFFGFCLGDAGYGLLFFVGAGIYKLKAAKKIKPYLTLIQLLGVATIIFGTISGTLFGINLIETEISLTDNVRGLFLNPDKMFTLSLILGGIQIIFGLFIRAANQTKQFGFQYALSTVGWLALIIGSVVYFLLVQAEIIKANKTILYAILGVGGFFVLFFSDPSVNVFARIGKGVWDIYSTVTGIFGDLLSYIRLFALGLSSAILGFVINDIGLQILGSSKILGPVFFAIFLILGHTLNILISSLGSFVHPMRLTFVEFYKNAGFKGGGKEYEPFKK
ncbi:V-type ATP synthase subunit I [Prolixibacteraceae bacterium Z1-6]|uniref:V-type ATP synthase subunit I n=1 Tax=Draconibacterium aestuarii TaxID=2998507 RepID=A0A9X3F2V2_9BACT|nr:V-type ATP synthase subunit I [Prolixibacteraceae bacterium Z1-6]